MKRETRNFVPLPPSFNIKIGYVFGGSFNPGQVTQIGDCLVQRLQTIAPHAPVFIMGDFNNCNPGGHFHLLKRVVLVFLFINSFSAHSVCLSDVIGRSTLIGRCGCFSRHNLRTPRMVASRYFLLRCAVEYFTFLLNKYIQTRTNNNNNNVQTQLIVMAVPLHCPC